MSQQNGGFPGEQQGQGRNQPNSSSTPHVFPFGNQQSQGQSQDGFGSGPQYAPQPQGGTPPQQWGSQPQQPHDPQAPYGGQAPQVPDQWQQPQGSQPQGSQPQSPQPWQQPEGAQPQGSPSQFSGILDPHTGEIHPVPDLQGLDETDALLVVVSGPDAGAQILLDTDVVTVGRSPNADIFLDDVTVSRKHAEFVRTPSGFTLRDTGSLNGTYVGRQLIDSIELQNGADVQIGKFRMIFQQRPRTS